MEIVRTSRISAGLFLGFDSWCHLHWGAVRSQRQILREKLGKRHESGMAPPSLIPHVIVPLTWDVVHLHLPMQAGVAYEGSQEVQEDRTILSRLRHSYECVLSQVKHRVHINLHSAPSQGILLLRPLLIICSSGLSDCASPLPRPHQNPTVPPTCLPPASLTSLSFPFTSSFPRLSATPPPVWSSNLIWPAPFGARLSSFVTHPSKASGDPVYSFASKKGVRFRFEYYTHRKALSLKNPIHHRRGICIVQLRSTL